MPQAQPVIDQHVLLIEKVLFGVIVLCLAAPLITAMAIHLPGRRCDRPMACSLWVALALFYAGLALVGCVGWLGTGDLPMEYVVYFTPVGLLLMLSILNTRRRENARSSKCS